MSDLVDYPEVMDLLKREGLEILVGDPCSRAFPGGPLYITFCNGAYKKEGDPSIFCGSDIPFSTLVEATIATIKRTESYREATTLYLRMPMELLEEPASFNDFYGSYKYTPSKRMTFFRIAFGDKKND